MKPNNSIGNMISNENIQKVRDFLLATLDTTDDNGEPDLEKIIHNATYNMGEGAVQIAGLILQESMKLETLERARREKERIVYEDIMKDRMGFTPTTDGVRKMVDGDPELSELKSKIKCEEEYIAFLKAAQEQVRFYPKNAKYIIDVGSYGKEIGKIL